MKKFKQLILSSQWEEAIKYCENLPFLDEKSKNRCKYLIYRHSYFDSLMKQKIEQALNSLRNHLKPISSQSELTMLSSLVAYSDQQELLQQINNIIYSVESQSGLTSKQNISNPNQKVKAEDNVASSDFFSISKDRRDLLCSTVTTQKQTPQNEKNQFILSQANYNKQTFQDSYTYLIHSIWDLIKERKSIPPVNRLNSIVKQAKSYQILKCSVHKSLPNNFSILENHYCRTKGYPNQLASQHRVHEDEVWHVQFSPNGLYAASICKKSTIAIWRIVKQKKHTKSSSSIQGSSSNPAQIKKKTKKQTSKTNSTSTPIQSNQQLLKDNENSPQTQIESTQALQLETCNQVKKKSPIQSNISQSKSYKLKNNEKKLAKKSNKAPQQKSLSKVELELVAKKDLNDNSSVQCFSWNQKGDMIVTSQENKHIIVWKINFEKQTIEQVKNLQDTKVKDKSIISIIFLPEKNDRSQILYTSEDKFIYKWDYQTDKEVSKIECGYDNQSIHLHPNMQDLISVCKQGRISLINLNKKQEVGFFVEKNEIVNANLSSDGSHILLSVLGKEINSLNMWNIETSELEASFGGYKQIDCYLRASMKDEYVAIGDEDGKIFIWHKNIPQKPICIIHNDILYETKIEQFPIGKNGFESCAKQATNNQSEYSNNMELESEKQKSMNLNDPNHKSFDDEIKKTINQVHFNPVYPGMLIAAGDDHTVRLFISDELNYNLPEKFSEKKKFSAIECIKQTFQSLIPNNKLTPNKNNNNQNQIMEEEEGEEEEEIQNKANAERSESSNQLEQEDIECEEEGDDEDEEYQQDCENEEDHLQSQSNTNEEQKLEQEENDTSSNAFFTNNQQNNP
ncbi:WD domain, G-beta repeat protein (macronuclear) [Tetrahymena thermophila SB210]|uniref:WD domain, G-beta repeat protein n=1 Tax=Tetrahymena thermophila (strain SB210) TaxID=312017 RepID=I7MAF9_TETTS|nr:WD domain, G-beta repeat protein [Tetrahymena thermophila SB210]EAS04516.1 WD domain, G-beta repeat protein [Tetrahymena thermophila SB210]|eukprot:XP_001024761.1 WD domain, G-beta repeat protein [Tetrahymena thermophila SB210]